MNRDEWITALRKRNVLAQLPHGPVSLMVRRKGKLVPAVVTMAGDQVQITTGRFFRRRVKIPLAQLKE